MLEELIDYIKAFNQRNEEDLSSIKSSFLGVRKSLRLITLVSNVGGLLVVVATILFVIGMALLFTEISEKIETDAKVREATVNLITKSHEPRKSNEYPGILSAILADKQTVDSIENTSREISRSLAELASLDVTDSFPQLPFISKNIGLTDQKSIYTYRNGVTFRSDYEGVLLPPTEISDFDDGQKVVDAFAAEFGGLKKGVSYLSIIRSLEKNVLLNSVITEETIEALVCSFKIFSDEFRKLTSKTYPQLYFVSPTGVFSHLVDESESTSLLDVAKNRPMYRWEASSYIQEYFKDYASNKVWMESQARATKLYLDIAGLGIVRTWTVPLSNSETGAPIGIICLDEVFSIQSLVNKSSLIMQDQDSTDEFGLTAWSNGVFDYLALRVSKNGEANSRKRQMLAKFLNRKVSELPGEFSSLREPVVKDIFEGDFFELAPNKEIDFLTSDISKVRLSNGRNEFVVVYISQSLSETGTIFSLRLGIGIILLIASIFLMTVGHYRKVEQNENAILANILRNLPVGVMELQQENAGKELEIDGVVRYANDAAEEIFLGELPRFGDSSLSTQEQKKFSSLLDLSTIFVRKENKALQGGSGESKNVYEIVEPEDLEELRRGGAVTSYYVRVKKRKEIKTDEAEMDSGDNIDWVRVTGSPINEEESIRTFGVISLITNQVTRKELNNTLDTYKKNNKRD